MKTIVNIRNRSTDKVVGTVTIEGNWGEPSFRRAHELLLNFYSRTGTKTDAEIRSSNQTVIK